MSQVALVNTDPGDSEGMKWAKLQLWVREAIDNAGIGYTLGGLLTDIALGDSEGVKFAKLQRWIRVLADGISTQGTARSGVDPAITSEDELAAIPTVGVDAPQIKVWIDATKLTSEIWRMLDSSAANDPGSVRRADDWAISGHVWFKGG